MITKNPMQFKALIKNISKEKNISAQLVMQNYMLERLLERISLSEYKYNFIIKGGFLISAIVGLDSRATMDLDTTIKGFTLTHEAITDIFEHICNIDIEDDISFRLVSVVDIRETDDYPGIRVNLKAEYPPVSVPLTVDVTTGDMITPRELNFSYPLVFDDRKIEFLAYTIETILAEKIETILSRSVANTRPRDYYDVYILNRLRRDSIDTNILSEALRRTTTKRNSTYILSDYDKILSDIRTNDQQRKFWEKYTRDYSYAEGIYFDDVCDDIMDIIESIT